MNWLRVSFAIFGLAFVLLFSSCISNLSGYFEDHENATRGIAIFEGWHYPANGNAIPSYTFITENGTRYEKKLCFNYPSVSTTERYVGCMFHCWYDAENPFKSRIFVCIDSLVFDEPSLGQLYGCMKWVRRKQMLTYVCYGFVMSDNSEFEWKEYLPIKYIETCKALCNKQDSVVIDFYHNPSKDSVLIPQINREFLDSLLINNNGN